MEINSNFYNSLARRITQILTQSGELPYTIEGFTYKKLEATYYNPGTADFAGLVYTNDWADYNIEDNYGSFFGPTVRLGEILPRVWKSLTEEEQT